MLSPEIMAYPKRDGLFILEPCASLVAIGAVLSQIQNSDERVVVYGSRTLGKLEINYCTTDRELLAAKLFMEHYKHYLLGKKILIMSAFDFDPGKKHGNADAMSWYPVPLHCQCPDALDMENLRCGPCAKCRFVCLFVGA